MTDSELIDIAHANAREFVETVAEKYDVHLDHDRAAVEWLDGFIAGRSTELRPETRAGLIDLLGSLVGECIIHCWSGHWQARGEQLVVHMGSDLEVDPFDLIARCLDHRANYKASVMFSAVPDIARVRIGGVYAVRNETGRYRLYKVLAADHLGVHVRVYRGAFDAFPGAVDIAQLDANLGDDLDVMGIGHMPLAHVGFWEMQPQLIRVVPIEETELEGYRLWLAG